MLKRIPLHLKHPLSGFKMPLQSFQICKRLSDVEVFSTGLIRLFFNENFGWQKEKPISLDKTQALRFDF
jgi:hypothetical protein